MLVEAPRSTLFPYTTLFRSRHLGLDPAARTVRTERPGHMGGVQGDALVAAPRSMAAWADGRAGGSMGRGFIGLRHLLAHDFAMESFVPRRVKSAPFACPRLRDGVIRPPKSDRLQRTARLSSTMARFPHLSTPSLLPIRGLSTKSRRCF